MPRAGRAPAGRGRGATDDPALRRDLLVEVAELHEQRLGNAAAAEKVYREILAGRAAARRAPSARWPACTATASAGPSCARLLDARQSRVADIRANVSTCWRRSPRSTRRCSTTPTTPSPATRRCWSWTRPIRAPTRRWTATTRRASAGAIATSCWSGGCTSPPKARCPSWSSAAPSCASTSSTTSTAPSISWRRSSRRTRRTKGRARCWRSAGASRRSGSARPQVLAPLYEAGSAWAQLVAVAGRSSARALKGARGRRAAGAHRRPAGEHAAGARGGAGHLARRCWPPTRPSRRRWPRSSGWRTTLERFTELVDVYQELAFRRDGADMHGARRSAVARRARCTPGRIGNRRAAIDAWKLVLNLDPENPDDRQAGGGRAGGAVRRDRRTSRRWSRSCACRWAGPTRLEARRDDAVPHRGAGREVAGRHRRGGGHAALDPGDGSRQHRGARSAGAASSRQGGQHRPARRDPAPAHRHGRRRGRRARRCGARSPACSRRTSATSTRRSPPTSPSSTRTRDDPGALDTLARLYEQQGRHADRLEILERRLALIKRDGASRQDVAARVEVLRRIAELSEGPLGNPSDALARWREILSLAPGDPGALAALERLLAAPGTSTSRALRLARGPGAGADLRERRPLRRAGGRPADLRRGAERPRARVGILMRLAHAAGDAPAAIRRRRCRTHGAGHPRRAGRAAVAGAARQLRTAGRHRSRPPR